ncbi:MAG: alpha/beta hydrolase [Streptosporangiaceae bacterium]
MSRQQREKIDAMFRQPRPQGPPPSVGQLRAGFAALMSAMIVPPGVRTTTTTLAGRPALSAEPEQGPRRGGTILYFHGGGNVFGSPEAVLPLTAQIVARTGFRAFSPDYRQAPEYPFPAAVKDTPSAYRALLDDGTDPAAIAFAGDSAGGGLTVTTCLAARDAGLPLPAAIVAFSPGLDATRTGQSMDTKAGTDPILTRAGMERTGAMYLAGQDPRQPLLSPAVMADLTGFPPILLQAGTNELLLDDSTRLAARATAAGVDNILDITAGVPHVFQSFAGGPLDEADQALDRAALFISQHIPTPGTATPPAQHNSPAIPGPLTEPRP